MELSKKLLVSLFGIITHPCLTLFNKTYIEGTEHLDAIDQTNVLFISNHQTYFWDVIAMLHLFNSYKWGFKDSISNPVYLLNPKASISYIAARETMQSSLIAKIMRYTGAILIDRTWRRGNRDVTQKVSFKEFEVVGNALSKGWVVTFPQGTTKPNAEIRRGFYHLVNRFKPTILPMVIDGFSKAFKHNGLKPLHRNVKLSLRIKSPFELDENESIDSFLYRIKDSIEQSK